MKDNRQTIKIIKSKTRNTSTAEKWSGSKMFILEVLTPIIVELESIGFCIEGEGGKVAVFL